MKKVTLERSILVPDADYCMLWKGGEVCPALMFRKDAKNTKTIWGCDYLDESLADNLTAFGVKKGCMVHEEAEIYFIEG